MDKKGKQIDVQLDEKIAEGTYCNLAIINHSSSEFILDFISILPGMPKARVKSRIVLTPQHTKSLLDALKSNINKFEENFGEIEENGPPNIPINFGPTGEA